MEQSLNCADCGSRMRLAEKVQHPTAKCRFLEFYQCRSESCGRKAVLQWERPDGELTERDISFVEREVLNRGSWFPSDSY